MKTAVNKILDVMPRGNTLADRSTRKEILREAFEYKQGREGFFAMVRAFQNGRKSMTPHSFLTKL